MNYRKLGRFGLKVSEVSLGGWLTHGRTLDDSATQAVVQKALDLGINFFDTADVYNRGEAELALGKALASVRREDVVIGTKCFFPMSENPNDRGLSRKHIKESVHNSLKRLQTDYIDLMQFHRFDPDTPLDETVRAIDDLCREGKVHYWGVSEWSAQQISLLHAIAKEMNANPPASNQPLYNMLHRNIEDDVMETCEIHGLGLVVFSPLAQGILTGKYEPGQPPPEGTRAADDNSNQFMTALMNDETLYKVQDLKKLANEQGYSLAQFALAWCLRRPAVTSVIVGASTPEQLEANASASGMVLNDDVWERAEKLLTAGF